MRNIRFIIKNILPIIVILIGVALFFNSCRDTPSDLKLLTGLSVRDVSGNTLTATIPDANSTTVGFSSEAAFGTEDVTIESITVSENATADKVVGGLLPVTGSVIKVTAQDGTSTDYSLVINIAAPQAPATKARLNALMVRNGSEAIGADQILVSTNYAAGNNATTAYGFVYSSTASGDGLVLNGTAVSANTLSGAPTDTNFRGTLSNLTAGTRYYIKAYATNGAGTAYSNQINTMTLAGMAPVLSDFVVREITAVEATFEVRIADEGNLSIIEYGIVYSTTSGTPLLVSLTTKLVGTTVNPTERFAISYDRFTPSTQYYARAYIITSQGALYSDNFLTFDTQMPRLATLTGVTFTNRGGSSFNATVGRYTAANNPTTAYGFIYSNTAMDDTNLQRGMTGVSDTGVVGAPAGGATTGNFSNTITNLDFGTTYYLRAYVTNAGGTAYSETQTLIATASWSLVTGDIGWPSRSGNFGTYVFNNKIWIIGGGDVVDYHNDIWNSTDGRSWSQVTVEGTYFGVKSSFFHAVHNNKMWVIGNLFIIPSNEVWATADGANWDRMPDFPMNYGNGSSVSFANYLWVLGGGTPAPSNTIYRTLTGTVWETITGAAWPARHSHSAVVFKNKMWILGGHTGNFNAAYNDVWSSSDGVTWEQHPDASWSIRGTSAAVVADNKIWVMGGGH